MKHNFASQQFIKHCNICLPTVTPKKKCSKVINTTGIVDKKKNEIGNTNKVIQLNIKSKSGLKQIKTHRNRDISKGGTKNKTSKSQQIYGRTKMISNLIMNLSKQYSPYQGEKSTRKIIEQQKHYFRKKKSQINESQQIVKFQTAKINPFAIKIIKKLGKGQSGYIYLAFSLASKLVVAIKQFMKNKVILQFLIDQFKIQFYCNHPNILPAYGFFCSKNDVFLIMQAGLKSLFDEIKLHGPFSQALTINYIRQILQGMQYLHQRSIIHRDLKPQNIIICYDGTLKISDFGWSSITNSIRHTFCGTLDYLSPQVSKGLPYSNKIDCWSIGVMTYQMLMLHSPFEGSKILKQSNSQYDKLYIPLHLSPKCQNFITKLLHKDPKKRLSISQALNHEWLATIQHEKDDNQIVQIIQ